LIHFNCCICALKVGTSVASAVGAAVASGAGGGAGASGGGGGGGAVMPLIGQVQFLNLAGRIGGTNGSDSMAAFSSGFGWANLELPASMAVWRQNGTAPGSRRTKTKAKLGCQASGDCAEDETETVTVEKCSFQKLMPSVERLCTCLSLLCSVYCLRVGMCLVFQYCLKKEVPSAFMFPNWHTFSKVLSIVALYTKCTWTLTFEKVCQGGTRLSGTILGVV